MTGTPIKRCLIIEIHQNDTNGVIKAVNYLIMAKHRKQDDSKN